MGRTNVLYSVINDVLSRVLKHGLISARILLAFLQQVQYVDEASVGYQIQFQDLFLRLLVVWPDYQDHTQNKD